MFSLKFAAQATCAQVNGVSRQPIHRLLSVWRSSFPLKPSEKSGLPWRLAVAEYGEQPPQTDDH
jgi:hypothetical protein